MTANVEKVALSNPQIAFRLIVDGNLKLETAGDGNLQNTIYAVFGKEFASRLIEVNSDHEGIVIKGFIGRTDNFKANRNYQNFFINGRFVKSKTAMAALEQAYTSYMPPEKFPCCVLYITINPSRVDVNVHPAKLEVKFSNEKAVFEAIYYTVRTALESNVTRPSMQLGFGTRSAKSAFAPKVSEAIAPVKDGKMESLASRQLSYDLENRTQPQPQARMTAEEYRNLYTTNKQGTSPARPASQAPILPKEAPDEVKNEGRVPIVEDPQPTPSPIPAPQKLEPKAEQKVEEKVDPKAEPQVQPQVQPTEERIVPFYRIVGEVFNSYVIVQVEEKMLIVDKHAAHERILFEQLKKGLSQVEAVSQMLMLPIDVMLTSGEVEALKQYNDELEKIGFSLRFARNTVSVDAIPEEVDSAAVPDMLGSMAGRILDNTGSVKLTRDIIFEKALYQAACKAAIKAGRAYADEHVKWIVDQLMTIPDITFCPHGRPVALEMSHHTLDKQFDRTGF